jgi:hypothetical protein
MKKAILSVLIILIVIIAGGLYYVFSNLDNIVKAAIEKYGSETTHTAVAVDDVKISLTDGSATIKGLTIANPPGFSLTHAFSLGEITTTINLDQTSNELIAIDLINIATPEVFYEINAERKGSLNLLKDNIGGSKTDVPAESAPSSGSQSSPLKLNISRFTLKDAKLHALVVPLENRTYDLKLPALLLSNLNGTPEQISRQILDQLIEHAKAEIKKKGLDKELATIQAEAQQRINAEKTRLREEAESKLKSEEGNVKDQLKNLLGN